jgi:hypothetical protein
MIPITVQMVYTELAVQSINKTDRHLGNSAADRIRTHHPSPCGMYAPRISCSQSPHQYRSLVQVEAARQVTESRAQHRVREEECGGQLGYIPSQCSCVVLKLRGFSGTNC